jgi:hypothetical protein
VPGGGRPEPAPGRKPYPSPAPHIDDYPILSPRGVKVVELHLMSLTNVACCAHRMPCVICSGRAQLRVVSRGTGWAHFGHTHRRQRSILVNHKPSPPLKSRSGRQSRTSRSSAVWPRSQEVRGLNFVVRAAIKTTAKCSPSFDATPRSWPCPSKPKSSRNRTKSLPRQTGAQSDAARRKRRRHVKERWPTGTSFTSVVVPTGLDDRVTRWLRTL